MKDIKIIVIGCGASGMTAAIAAARQGAAVKILEKNDRPGKKLLATGNGRCNFTNINAAGSDYPGPGTGFASGVLDRFGAAATIEFFEQLGIFPRIESEGRVYPYSEQALSVLESLLTELRRLNVEIVYSCPVAGMRQSGGSFAVTAEGGRQFKADRIILATGGKAGSQYGSTGDGYALAASFGHHLTSPRPALVQLVCDAGFFKELKGVRAKGAVSLADAAMPAGVDMPFETGEIQFTDTGLSGICIFNLSRHIGKLADLQGPGEASKISVRIDLIPEMSRAQLKDKLMERRLYSGHKTLEDFLNGIVNKKLIPVILKESKVWGSFKNSAALDETAIDRLVHILKGWDIRVTGTKGWRDAQVTAGGIPTDEIDGKSMESIYAKGLYFAGEIIDIDGRCGGYNLQWAWSSGYMAGLSAAGESGGADDQGK